MDKAITNYHQIQIFFQNYISSVKYTRVINYPMNYSNYIIATFTINFTSCFTCIVSYWFYYLLQI